MKTHPPPQHPPCVLGLAERAQQLQPLRETFGRAAQTDVPIPAVLPVRQLAGQHGARVGNLTQVGRHQRVVADGRLQQLTCLLDGVRLLPQHGGQQHLGPQQADLFGAAVRPANDGSGLGEHSFHEFGHHLEAFGVLEDASPALQVLQGGRHGAPVHLVRQIRDQVECDRARQQVGMAQRECVRDEANTILLTTECVKCFPDSC